MPKPPIDPLRAKLVELVEEMSSRLANLRDYSVVPGNAWLAKGELGQINQLISDLETVVEEIKAADAENGF